MAAYYIVSDDAFDAGHDIEGTTEDHLRKFKVVDAEVWSEDKRGLEKVRRALRALGFKTSPVMRGAEDEKHLYSCIRRDTIDNERIASELVAVAKSLVAASSVKSGYYQLRKNVVLQVQAERATWNTNLGRGNYYVNGYGELFRLSSGGSKEKAMFSGLNRQITFNSGDTNADKESARQFLRSAMEIENPTQVWICEIQLIGAPTNDEVLEFIDYLDESMMILSGEFGDFRSSVGKKMGRNKVRLVISGPSGSPRKLESELKQDIRRFLDRFPSIDDVSVDVKVEG